MYAKKTEGTGAEKKNDKGKGKEKERRRKQRWVEEDKDEEDKEEEEIKSEAGWRSFVTNRMMVVNIALEGLARENVELQKEVREMRKENTED